MPARPSRRKRTETGGPRPHSVTTGDGAGPPRAPPARVPLPLAACRGGPARRCRLRPLSAKRYGLRPNTIRKCERSSAAGLLSMLVMLDAIETNDHILGPVNDEVMYRGRIRVIRRRVCLSARVSLTARIQSVRMRIMTASKSSRAETRLSLSLYRSGPSGRGQPSFPQGPGLACLRRRAVSPSSGDFPRSPRSQNPTRTQTATTVPRTKRDFLNDGVDYVAAPRSGDRCTTRNMNRYGFTRQHTALRGHAQNVKGITAASGRDEQPRASRTSWRIPHPVANTCSSAR